MSLRVSDKRLAGQRFELRVNALGLNGLHHQALRQQAGIGCQWRHGHRRDAEPRQHGHCGRDDAATVLVAQLLQALQAAVNLWHQTRTTYGPCACKACTWCAEPQ
jgi:hypothetical protein